MSPSSRPSLRLWAVAACAVLALHLLGGCASTGNPRDPLEGLNRGVYKFNDAVDNILVKPAAEAYRDVVPAAIRTGIGNFFSNLQDVLIALNNLLQGKMPDAINDFGRVMVNTTLGVFGVMDVATELGVEKHDEDFGQTLGRWGLEPGPYLVLPFLGPSSVRDAVGLIGDWKTSPLTYVEPTRTSNQLYGVFYVNRRSELLEASRILETAALDPYEFVRDGYLQRRRNLVYDGNPPEENGNENDSGARDKGAAAPPRVDPDVKARAAPPASQPRGETSSPARHTRVVRIWLPAGSN